MTYQALLFDLDGTLADSLPGIEWAFHFALHETLPDVPLEPLRDFIGPPIERVLDAYLEMNAPQLQSQMSNVQRSAVIATFRSAYDGEGWARSQAFEQVREVLEEFKENGINCFVVTNKPALPRDKILHVLNIREYFQAAISPDDKQPPYTDKSEMVTAVLQRFNLSLAKTLLIGDATDDACSAFQNNVDFAAVSYGYGEAHLQTEFPVRFRIDKFSQLLAVCGLEKVLAL